MTDIYLHIDARMAEHRRGLGRAWGQLWGVFGGGRGGGYVCGDETTVTYIQPRHRAVLLTSARTYGTIHFTRCAARIATTGCAAQLRIRFVRN